jgi:hypothetical protein
MMMMMIMGDKVNNTEHPNPNSHGEDARRHTETGVHNLDSTTLGVWLSAHFIIAQTLLVVRVSR